MMTIKEFAQLCSCNTQTLRYYDRIDLLKPAKTDKMTGYRYYHESQAIDFVKIKNLQSADFSIDQIKALLLAADEQIVEAFEEKIRNLTEKLEHIRKIQKSYLKEKKMMEKAVASMTEYITNQINDEEMMKEFGFNKEDKEKIKELINKYFTHHLLEGLKKGKGELTLQINDQLITGEDNVIEAIESLDGGSLKDTIIIGKEDTSFVMNEEFDLSMYELVWEKHGWNSVQEFLDEVPKMADGKEYTFFFELSKKDNSVGLTFAMCLIVSMVLRNDGRMINMGCDVDHSKDGKNHVKLYYKQAGV